MLYSATQLSSHVLTVHTHAAVTNQELCELKVISSQVCMLCSDAASSSMCIPFLCVRVCECQHHFSTLSCTLRVRFIVSRMHWCA